MIPKRELLEIATNSNLTAQVIEKDYVIGWIMAGINQHKEIGNTWVFKGGTCLKKCYFETYRFSEDLDFTLRDKKHINADFLKTTFGEISEWIYEKTGIEIPNDRMIFEVYENPRGVLSCQGRLFYKGPCAPQSEKSLPRIKLDLSTDEIIVMSPVKNPINHTYSDLPPDVFQIECYPYEEVFAEKIRALGERTRPRDLYDVINFYRRPESKERAPKIKEILIKKCEFKKIKIPMCDILEEHKDSCAAGWDDQLSHQLPTLPPFESFWQELPEFFNWLSNTGISRRILNAIPVRADATQNISDIDIRQYGGIENLSLLERIRFAAANHLCVELVYRREDGTRNTYLIEPYSLRRTSDGNLLLYSIKNGTSEIGAFRIDRIINATATNINFIPKYNIEFLTTGSLNTHVAVANNMGQRLGLIKKRKKSFTPKVSRKQSFVCGSKIKYIFQCPLCMKTFPRSTMNSRLNSHKNKSGWNCPGRIGYFISSKY